MAIPRLGDKGQGWVLLQVLLLLVTAGVGVLGLVGAVTRWGRYIPARNERQSEHWLGPPAGRI